MQMHPSLPGVPGTCPRCSTGPLHGKIPRAEDEEEHFQKTPLFRAGISHRDLAVAQDLLDPVALGFRKSLQVEEAVYAVGRKLFQKIGRGCKQRQRTG